MSRLHRLRPLSGWAGASALVIASIGAAHAAPVFQSTPEASGARVEQAGCWWVQGPWGAHQVCRGHDHDDGHYDYHPGHWDRHYDHYDYHPGHYDYHHQGHRHHLDEE
jgi:hypothetical protein